MRRVLLSVTATVVGLILLLQFKTHPADSGVLATVRASPPANQHRSHLRPPAAGRRTSTATPAPTQRTAAARPRTESVTGQLVQTPYGPVQVRIVERGGRLTDIVPLQLPGDNPRSSEIAAGAAPVLRSEALHANSAHIHIVSGATYTSDGYAQSLQSAIDHA